MTPAFVIAQATDDRQRVASTIIADVLDQLPAENNVEFYKMTNDLMSTGESGLKSLTLMLNTVEKEAKAKVEYALDGLSRKVFPMKKSKQRMFYNALLSSIDQMQDVSDKAFLMSLFANFAAADQVEPLLPYLLDDELAMVTMQTLMAIEGSEPYIEACVMEAKADKKILAYAAAHKKLKSTEDVLISWLNGADDDTKKAVYYALSQLGGTKSLPILRDNAKSVKYKDEPTEVTTAYVNIVNKLALEKDTANVLKETKKLLKVKRANIKIAALNALVNLYGGDAVPTLIKHVKNKDAQVRNEALRLLAYYGSEQNMAEVVKVAKKKAVKADVIRWLANFNNKSQIEFIKEQADTKDENIAEACIYTLCKIGGENDLVALFPLMTEQYRDVMVESLAAYHGSSYHLLVKCFDEGNDEQKITALKVIDKRKMYAICNYVIEQCISENVSDDVRAAAYAALNNVVRVENMQFLRLQLVRAPEAYVKDIQDALITLFSDKNAFNPNTLNNTVNFYKEQAPSAQARFYPVFASNEKFISLNYVLDAYNSGINEKEALDALLTMDHKSMIEVLYNIAKDDALNRDEVLKRYIYLVEKYGDSEVTKVNAAKKALDLNPNDEVKNIIIKALENTNSYQAIMLAASYLDNEKTLQTAANVILNIAYKNPDYNGDELVELLQRIKDVFTDGDALYKKAQIEEHLAKIAKTPVFTLSEEEKKEGFVILFDGTNLDKWVGDKTNYIVKNGNIYVSANYGNDGNLYTEKEYSDFIYRFEFCYLRSGVNNGVGIRTPMNVDAAYEGMEIQILDHDAPIYQGLREYQVHGSVYGIVPAERVVFPELGTWNTEEIMIKGDHIRVTVNGQVIVDADIRKACKGHNVALDGSKNNPYTVDNQNHPGLFNKKGYISFCGHGEGLLIRNIRIKEL